MGRYGALTIPLLFTLFFALEASFLGNRWVYSPSASRRTDCKKLEIEKIDICLNVSNNLNPAFNPGSLKPPETFRVVEGENNYSSSKLKSVLSYVFSPGKHPKALISDRIYLNITSKSYIYVMYISEGAGYWNSLGFFLYDWQTKSVTTARPVGDPIRMGQIIFPAIETGYVRLGDTVRIGPFNAGETLGFFLVQDGWRRLHQKRWYQESFPSFLNPGIDYGDKIAHVAWVYSSELEATIFGFEDETGGGDADYEDVVFSFQVEGSAEVEDLPVWDGKKISTCATPSSIDSESYSVFNCKQYMLLRDAAGDCSRYLRINSGWIWSKYSASARDVLSYMKPQWSHLGVRCVLFNDGNNHAEGHDFEGNFCEDEHFSVINKKGESCYYTNCTTSFLFLEGSEIECSNSVGKYCDPLSDGEVILSRNESQYGLVPTDQVLYINKRGTPFGSKIEIHKDEFASADIQIILLLDLGNDRGEGYARSKCIEEFSKRMEFKSASFLYIPSGSDGWAIGSGFTKSPKSLQDQLAGFVPNSYYQGATTKVLNHAEEILGYGLPWRAGSFRVMVVASKYKPSSNPNLEKVARASGVSLIFLSPSSISEFREVISKVPGSLELNENGASASWSSRCWLDPLLGTDEFSKTASGIKRQYSKAVNNINLGSQYIPRINPTSGVEYKSSLIEIDHAYYGVEPESKSVASAVSVSGWGIFTTILKYNNPPHVNAKQFNVSGRINVEKDSHPIIINLPVADTDRNLIKVIITKNVGNGELRFDSVPIVVGEEIGTEFKSGNVLVYYPNQLFIGDDSFLYQITDGCDRLQEDFMVGISINDIDFPPILKPLKMTSTLRLTLEEAIRLPFTSAVDMSGHNVSIHLKSIPSPSIGTLYDEDGNQVKYTPYYVGNHINGTVRFVPSPDLHVPVKTTFIYSGTTTKGMEAQEKIELEVEKTKINSTLVFPYFNNTVYGVYGVDVEIQAICGDWNYDEYLALKAQPSRETIVIPDDCKNMSMETGSYVCKFKWQNPRTENEVLFGVSEVPENSGNPGVISFLNLVPGNIPVPTFVRTLPVRVQLGDTVKVLIEFSIKDATESVPISIFSRPKHGTLLCSDGSQCGDSTEAIDSSGGGYKYEFSYKSTLNHEFQELEIDDSFWIYVSYKSVNSAFEIQHLKVYNSLPPLSQNVSISLNEEDTYSFNLNFERRSYGKCRVCFLSDDMHGSLTYPEGFEEVFMNEEYFSCTLEEDHSVPLVYESSRGIYSPPEHEIKFYVYDKTVRSPAYTLSVHITHVNHNPVVKSESFEFRVRANHSIEVAKLITDPDAMDVSFEIRINTLSVELGQLTVNGEPYSSVLEKWIPGNAVIEYYSEEFNFLPSVNIVFIAKDSGGLISILPGSIDITSIPGGFQPQTTLKSMLFSQGIKREIPITSPEYVTTETPGAVTCLKLVSIPSLGELHVDGVRVESLDKVYGSSSVFEYLPSLWYWGDALGKIVYTLRDDKTLDEYNAEYELVINVSRIQKPPVLKFNSTGFEKVLGSYSKSIYSHESLVLRFNVTDPDSLLGKVSNRVNSASYSRSAYNLSCTGEILINESSSRSKYYEAKPQVFDSLCKKQEDLNKLEGAAEHDCSLQYEMLFSTVNSSEGSPFVILSVQTATDDQVYQYSSTERISINVYKLNRPPSISAPETIKYTELGEQLALDVSIADEAPANCLETLLIEIKTGSGYWEFPENSCVQNQTTLTCNETLENYDTLIRSIRFICNSSDSDIVLLFTIFDNGCGGSRADSNNIHYNSTASTVISRNLGNKSSKNTVIIISVLSSVGAAALLGTSAYLYRRLYSNPSEDYFELDGEAFSTSANQNPLFKKAFEEVNSPLFHG